MDTVTVKFFYADRVVDIEIPLSITAQELIVGLNEAYSLGINISDINMCYLQAENPIALLKGNKTLEEYALRNGTEIYFIS